LLVGFAALGEERYGDERHARSDLAWPAMRRGGQERQCAGLWKRRSAWTTWFSSSTDYEMENRVEESRLVTKPRVVVGFSRSTL
jgi:heme-degrading monooxygenase HmoA